MVLGGPNKQIRPYVYTWCVRQTKSKHKMPHQSPPSHHEKSGSTPRSRTRRIAIHASRTPVRATSRRGYRPFSCHGSRASAPTSTISSSSRTTACRLKAHNRRWRGGGWEGGKCGVNLGGGGRTALDFLQLALLWLPPLIFFRFFCTVHPRPTVHSP